MRSPKFLIALTLGSLLAAVGCTESGGAEAPDGEASSRTFTDDAGRTVTLPVEVERIAAAASFAAEYLVMLDHPPVVRPNAPIDDSPNAAALEGIPTIAIDHSVGPNIEQIAAADPDVVIVSPSFARFVETIEAAADTTAIVLRIDSLDDVPAKAEQFGRLIGDEAAGERLAARLQRRIDRVAAPDVDESPTVFAMFGTPAANFAFLPDSYLGSMVEHLGGRLITDGSPASGMSTQLAPFSFEALVAADPDVILMVHHGPPGQMAEALADRPAWSALKAVRSGRVHRVSERLFMTNPGPSAIEALTHLRTLLYPEAGDEPSR